MSKTPQPPARAADLAGAQRSIVHEGLTWLDIRDPRPAQVSALRERFGFHPLHLDDVLSRIQRPKIDDNPEQGYLFLVLHFPVFNKTTRLPVISEVDIFVGDAYVITAHDGLLKPLGRLAEEAAGEEQSRVDLMGRGSGYLLYRIIATLIGACFPMLFRLDEKLDRLDAAIFEDDVLRIVQELSFLRRDIISLRRIVRPNIPVVRSLEVRERPFLHVDEDAYFGDLTDGLNRIWDMLEEQKEIIDGLDATIGSLNSHRINREIKIFTVISVIFLPMTLLASVLGMNVPIPFAEEPLSFFGALLIMGALGGAMLLFFRFRRWI
ncbi:MAG TPA: magnesium transporter CorA family protein [Roseiflexaceae bacterium]|nr:magnesium transporter CorA family protein [Roseiflexaceae bacterium]